MHRARQMIGAQRTLTPYLHVLINIVGAAFHIRTDFRRFATWSIADGSLRNGDARVRATTSKARSSAYILGSLDEALDKFINAYLKANQDTK